MCLVSYCIACLRNDGEFIEEPGCSEERIREARAIVEAEYARIGCAHRVRKGPRRPQ